MFINFINAEIIPKMNDGETDENIKQYIFNMCAC